MLEVWRPLCGGWDAAEARGGVGGQAVCAEETVLAKPMALGQATTQAGSKGRWWHERQIRGLGTPPIRCDFYWDFPGAQDSRYQTPRSLVLSQKICILFARYPSALYFSLLLNPNPAAFFPCLCSCFTAIISSFLELY